MAVSYNVVCEVEDLKNVFKVSFIEHVFSSIYACDV